MSMMDENPYVMVHVFELPDNPASMRIQLIYGLDIGLSTVVGEFNFSHLGVTAAQAATNALMRKTPADRMKFICTEKTHGHLSEVWEGLPDWDTLQGTDGVVYPTQTGRKKQ